MRDERATFTNMCMVYDGDYVLVQNPTKKYWPGLRFPGGHVELGESFVDSTIREVYEETGLTISNLKLCGMKQFTTEETGRYIVIYYKTDTFSGELVNTKEGEVFWVHKDKLKDYELCENFEETYRIFTEDFSEFYNYKEDDEWKYDLK